MKICFWNLRHQFAINQENIWIVWILNRDRNSRPEVFCKKGVLKNFAKFSRKHLCQSLFFNKVEACNVIKIEALAQVFSIEFCEISEDTFFHRTPLVAPSVDKLY